MDLKGEQQGAPAAKSAGLMIPLPLELPARPYSLEPLAVKVDATGDRVGHLWKHDVQSAGMLCPADTPAVLRSAVHVHADLCGVCTCS